MNVIQSGISDTAFNTKTDSPMNKVSILLDNAFNVASRSMQLVFAQRSYQKIEIGDKRCLPSYTSYKVCQKQIENDALKHESYSALPNNRTVSESQCTST